MRLGRLSRYLVAVVLAGGGPASATPPPSPVVEEVAPRPLPALTDWVPVSLLDVAQQVRRPRGTVAMYLDVMPDLLIVTGRDPFVECGEVFKRCPWWDGAPAIAFVRTGHRGVVREWGELGADLRRARRRLDEDDPVRLALETLIAGRQRPRKRVVWTNPGRRRGAVGFPEEMELIAADTPGQRLDPALPLPLDVPIHEDTIAARFARLAAGDARSPAEQALAAIDDRTETMVVRALGRGFLVQAISRRGCRDRVDVRTWLVGFGDPLEVDQRATTTAICQTVGGRRPPGLIPAEIGGRDHPGRWLAELAHLEAASVPAFERLAGELAALGAPAALIARARAAADDERRHARVVGALAAAHAAAPPAVALDPVAPRDPLAIALDNAVEGCVLEAFAALTCAYQAARAEDRAVADALAAIADDEAGHGDLAWAIARWLEPRLPPAARAEVVAARAAALAALPARAAAAAAATAPAVRAALGLPPPAHARALATGYAAAATAA